MKKVTILALHLAYGGVEKAITNMANLFIEHYEVEIICMYDLPNAPAYAIDERVNIRYLMKDIPNKEAFKTSLRNKKLIQTVIEGCKSVKILTNKKRLMKKTIKQLHNTILISTRHEDTVMVNEYAHDDVYTIAQLHHDHNFNKKLIHDFRHKYKKIKVFALLNDTLCEEVTKIMKGYNETTRCISIPNFIEIGKHPIQVENRERTLLAVGRLDPVKGFDRLIDMMSSLIQDIPEYSLRIIGEGDQGETLQNLIERNHLQNHVFLLGRKTSEEIQAEMSKASMYVMTSYNEGFGIVLVEAMSCGLPSIAFDVRVGPCSILHDNKDGYLIKDNDKEGFCTKIKTLAHDEQLRIELGKQALHNAQAYSKETIASVWLNVLEKKI